MKKLQDLEYKLVKSRAGHDKGSWYAVIEWEDTQEDGFVFIADGRRRKIERLKKKSIKHLEMTNKIIKLDYFTNKSLRKALWEYNFGGKLSVSPENPD